MITYPTDKLQKVLLSGGCEQNGTPTPDNPIDIVCNNGVLKVSPNLFDKTATTEGYFYNAQLQYTTSNISSLSDYIPVVAGQTYTLTGYKEAGGNFNIRINYFDANKEIQSQDVEPIEQGDYSFTITIPSGIKYLRYSFRTEMQDSQQLELGSTATPYMPYGQIYTDGTVETVEVTGKNLFDPNQEFVNGYINDNGNLVNLPSLKTTVGYIKVSPNTTYTISYFANKESISNMNISLWTNNNTFIGREARQEIKETGVHSLSFTTTATTAKLRVTIWSDDKIYKDFQLEQGSTATTYEPYYNGGSATAEMLLKVGNYQDVQSIIDGKVTRNVGIKVLDGTEDWNSLDGYFNILKTGMGTSSTVLPRNSLNILCTHYKVQTSITGDLFINAGGNYINFKDTTIPSLAEWKTYLTDQYANGTPVIIVYPLATATTEQVTPQSLAGSSATVTAGSIDNLPIESSTIAELKKRYIGDKEVKKVYIGENIVYNRND